MSQVFLEDGATLVDRRVHPRARRTELGDHRRLRSRSSGGSTSAPKARTSRSSTRRSPPPATRPGAGAPASPSRPASRWRSGRPRTAIPARRRRPARRSRWRCSRAPGYQLGDQTSAGLTIGPPPAASRRRRRRRVAQRASRPRSLRPTPAASRRRCRRRSRSPSAAQRGEQGRAGDVRGQRRPATHDAVTFSCRSRARRRTRPTWS